MMKRPEQRVVVLIDTQNMYHSAKYLFGSHLNFAKLVETVVADRCLIRALAYVATSKNGDEKGFLGALVANGIEIKSKDVIEFASGERKADWDVGLAIDAVKFSDKVDVVILVSGDGDFVPLVQYLQNKGVAVEVAAFGESTSKQLKDVVDDYFDISQHPTELLMPTGRRTQPATFGGAQTADTDMDLDFDIPEEDQMLLDEQDAKAGHKGPGRPRKIRVTT
ncbi:MAG: NYN domain-containing protein [Patescibacteria group bacterium]